MVRCFRDDRQWLCHDKCIAFVKATKHAKATCIFIKAAEAQINVAKWSSPE